MYEVESSFGGGVAANLLLDDHPSTIPCFSVRNKLTNSLTGDFITIVKNDGVFNPSQDFAFEGNNFPSAEVLSFLGGTLGIVADIACQNTVDTYSQGTYANMPIIAESGVINTNANGVALKFDGTRYMTIAASQGLFKAFHSTTPSSQLLEYEANNLSTQFLFSNWRNSNRIGSYFAHNILALNNRFTARVQAPAGAYPVQAFNNQATSGGINVVFNTIDVTNGVAADRNLNYINGVLNKTNASSTGGGSASAAADIWHMGRAAEGGTNYLTGSIAHFIGWENSQEANRVDILNILYPPA